MTAFETTFQVRFGHVDPAGIAYYPRIFDYLHDVFEELWEDHVGERYYHLLLEQHIAFPLVHTDVDFKRPLRFGDQPLVRVTCFRLGATSVGLRYRVYKDEVLCVDARMVTVCVDARTLETKPIPEAFRVAFAAIKEPTATP
jgi:4-hydroxybenzoyl-CoA thioesterase